MADVMDIIEDAKACLRMAEANDSERGAQVDVLLGIGYALTAIAQMLYDAQDAYGAVRVTNE